MHISSLSSPGGIGTLGKEAYEFADFLARAGQKYWQILPVCPTSYGDSPYQSFSTFAGNPYFIDLRILADQGLLTEAEIGTDPADADPERVDYGFLYQTRYKKLEQAATRFLADRPAAYEAFLEEEKEWLPDYALFMALKDAYGGASVMGWEDPYRLREPEALEKAAQEMADRIEFWEILQYFFYQQWRDLKSYVNDLGIRIIGDIPIYVSMDSVDLWAHPEVFQLDDDLRPTAVAGCPPDSFSAVGQLWGNPLFDWEAQKKDGYSWWVNRLRRMADLYDVVRIDHFRGFAGYYAIPYGDTDARNGQWKPGPGIDLFDTFREKLGHRELIAEDLGFLSDDVYQLLEDCGYPGMKILEFAFDSRDAGNYYPHNWPVHCVAYTGTHDNEPVLGWMETAPEADVREAIEYLALTEEEGASWGMMRGLWSSAAELTIVPAQDLLGLGHESRMNTPATTGANWSWRAKEGVFSAELADILSRKMKLYER